jgi:hypothetical protein
MPRAPESNASLWITMVQAALLGLVAGLGAYVLISLMIGQTARAEEQRRPEFRGGPPPPLYDRNTFRTIYKSGPSASRGAILDVAANVVQLGAEEADKSVAGAPHR